MNLKQLFSFSEKKDSILAGFSYILCINSICILFLLLTYGVAYLFNSEQIGLNFFILYMVNLIIFTKHLFFILATSLAKAKQFYFKNNWGTLLGSLLMLLLIVTISIKKFELLPLTSNKSAYLYLVLVFTYTWIGYCGFTNIHVLSNTSISTGPYNGEANTLFIEKKKLNLLKGAFFLVAVLFFFCLSPFLFL